MKAYWTESSHRTVSSAAELAAVIAEVHALEAPTMLFLEQDSGSTLVLGLGAPESVLTFVHEDGSSYHSCGDAQRRDMLKFWCREQLDDFGAEMAIAESVAIAAAHEFYAKGTQPSNLEWEADW